MKKKPIASKETVMAFIKEVYPEYTEACITFGTEESMLRDATNLIRALRAKQPPAEECDHAWQPTTTAGVEHCFKCDRSRVTPKPTLALEVSGVLAEVRERGDLAIMVIILDEGWRDKYVGHFCYGQRVTIRREDAER